MKHVTRGLRVAGWILCTVGLATVALATTLGGVGSSRVLSESMAPSIKPGDVVVTRPIALSRLGVGDIPVLLDPRRGSTPIAHRILSVEPTTEGYAVLTKGDANPAPDAGPLIVTSDPVPVVWAVVPLSFLPPIDVRLLLGGMAVFAALALGSVVHSMVRPEPDDAGSSSAPHFSNQDLPR